MDDFGAYDDTKWRFFRYETGVYNEYPNAPADELVAGKAYWILVAATGSRFDTANLLSAPLEPFEIELAPGWNDVGSPFVAPLSVSAASVGATVDGPYAYTGSWVSPGSISTLEPWTGYSWYNPNGFAVTLEIDPIPAAVGAKAGSSRASAHVSSEWSLQLSASAGDARDADNVLGIASTATASKDPFDYTEPRMIGDGVRLAFHGAEGDGLLCSDYRAPESGLLVWDVIVETKAREESGAASSPFLPVVIDFAPSGALPSGWIARVVSTDRVGDALLPGAEYPSDASLPSNGALSLDASRPGTLTLSRLSRDGDLARGEFTVLAGPREAFGGEGSLETPSLVWSVENLGPNPFQGRMTLQLDLPESAPTVATLFDASGRRVLALADEVLTPGRHVLTWNGRDRNGQAVPSGVYFWEVRLGTERFQGRATRVTTGR